MSELENIVETEDSTKKNPQEEEKQSDPSNLEVDLDSEKPEEVDWKARAMKAEETALNYKREIEAKGLRRKDYVEDLIPKISSSESSLTDDQIAKIQDDYLSKRQDIFDEVKEDVSSLTEEEWSKVKSILTPALDNVYLQAVKRGGFSARGEIKRAMVDLISYAKGVTSQKKEVERARLQGMKDQMNLDAAEIGGVRTRSNKGEGKVIEITDEDRKTAEESGGVWTPERAAEIRQRKESRVKEYAPHPFYG